MIKQCPSLLGRGVGVTLSLAATQLQDVPEILEPAR